MRIITGKYKGRHFQIPKSFSARPTTDFAKENLFNVLRAYVDWEDTPVLDLFGGTGSMSMEFLSRGCPAVVTVEMDRNHAAFISVVKKKQQKSGKTTVQHRKSGRRSNFFVSVTNTFQKPCLICFMFQSGSAAGLII